VAYNSGLGACNLYAVRMVSTSSPCLASCWAVPRSSESRQAGEASCWSASGFNQSWRAHCSTNCMHRTSHPPSARIRPCDDDDDNDDIDISLTHTDTDIMGSVEVRSAKCRIQDETLRQRADLKIIRLKPASGAMLRSAVSCSS
jgi:hypothetical protein